MAPNADAATPSVLRRQGLGIIVAVCFGALWAAWAHSWLERYPAFIAWTVYAIAAAVCIALLAAAFAAIRRARQGSGTADTGKAVRRRTARQYWLIVIAEVVVLNVAAATLFRFGLGQYLAPAIAIIVGLHFFPLARTFRAPPLYATATLMTLAGIAAVLAILAGEPAVVATGSAEMACALVLWGTAYVSWKRTRNTGGTHSATVARAASG